ncbi:hypothetical protein WJX74_000313 [Apatococcus lobatus]|uniref:Uncharacterized protein n=1 Tax=Apatococcus lobatus TaxID=904363 RepID=A0AAW1R2H0_9CHLO
MQQASSVCSGCLRGGFLAQRRQQCVQRAWLTRSSHQYTSRPLRGIRRSRSIRHSPARSFTVEASSQQNSRKRSQGSGLLRIPGPWWLLAGVLPATGLVGAFAVALLFGSLGVAASLFWVCGAAIASTLGIFIFAPWLVLAATLTAALTLPLTAAVGFFLFQRWRTARLAQEMQERKSAAEAASAEGKPLDADRQEAVRLAEELRDFDAQLGRRR